jgi:hypothetical protein
MALILHGVLNNDQYIITDIYYPSFDKIIDKLVTVEEDKYDLPDEFTDED